MHHQLIVVQSEHLSPEAAAWLTARCRLIVCPYTSDEFRSTLASADGLVVRTYTEVNQQLLAAAPRLKVVGRAGVGLDNIDVHACRSRNIEIVYTPDANTQAVVEYVIALVMDAIRPRVRLLAATSSADWNALREQTVGQRQLNQMTFGILGLGRVGRRLAAVAQAIGCRVLFNDLVEIPHDQRHGAEPVSAADLFGHSDIVSIHIDGRPSNRSFIDATLLSRLKPDAIFINTSRGFVVENLALAQWLGSHPQALALLDVHHPEPFDDQYPLLNLPNARLYPHLASRTETAMNNMSWVVKDVLAVLEGRKPQFPAPG